MLREAVKRGRHSTVNRAQVLRPQVAGEEEIREDDIMAEGQKNEAVRCQSRSQSPCGSPKEAEKVDMPSGHPASVSSEPPSDSHPASVSSLEQPSDSIHERWHARCSLKFSLLLFVFGLLVSFIVILSLNQHRLADPETCQHYHSEDGSCLSDLGTSNETSELVLAEGDANITEAPEANISEALVMSADGEVDNRNEMATSTTTTTSTTATIIEIAFDPSQSLGFALEQQGAELDVVRDVKKGSQAYQKNVFIGMRITKIDGVEKQGREIGVALRNAKEALAITIEFNTSNVTVPSSKDTDRYHNCLIDMEKLELDILFDGSTRKDDLNILKSVNETISKLTLQHLGRSKASGFKTLKGFKDLEGFQNIVEEVLYGIDDSSNEDYSVGAGDICEYMIACAKSSCPLSPKQKLNEIHQMILREIND